MLPESIVENEADELVNEAMKSLRNNQTCWLSFSSVGYFATRFYQNCAFQPDEDNESDNESNDESDSDLSDDWDDDVWPIIWVKEIVVVEYTRGIEFQWAELRLELSIIELKYFGYGL